MSSGILPASFRDPSGFVFQANGELFRQVNLSYQEDYDLLISSGLYDALVSKGLLVAHTEVLAESPAPDSRYKILKPEPIEFISYPYEWSFSQLKHASLAILEIQRISLDFGMCLKDASAYNIQFKDCKPILIDSLSFQRYRKDRPWVAYGQFCRHFVAPLALMSYRDIRLGQMLRLHTDGIPLDLASHLLPSYTRLVPSLLTHLHLHAASQHYFAKRPPKGSGHRMSPVALRGLIDNLKTTVSQLKWAPERTQWVGYYTDTNYSPDGMLHKQQVVCEYLKDLKPHVVWDIGANTGLFSRIAAGLGASTIALDADAGAVEENYLQCLREKQRRILPLVVDLINPSPGLGWANKERDSLLQRGPADTVLALALVHHLAIGSNVPLGRIMELLSLMARTAVVEFIPKNDSQVKRMLLTRDDVFSHYSLEQFQCECERHFTICRVEELRDSCRLLFMLRAKDN